MTTEAKPAITREEFDTLTETKYGSMPLPGGRRILFRSLPRSAMYAIDAEFFGDDGKTIDSLMPTRPAKIMAAVLCDGSGNRLFTDDEWSRVDALPSGLFEPLWTAVRKHLGLEKSTEEPAVAPNE